MIFPQKTITNHVLLISALFGLCFCDNPPLTIWQINNEFEFPICAKITNTEIDAQQQPTILRFCPNEKIEYDKFGEFDELEQFCLFETTNENEMPCAETVDPLIRALDYMGGCGFKNEGTLYEFGYKLCGFGERDTAKILSFKTIYTFCFDHNAKKVVYVEHGIFSPTLINHEELPEEQTESISFNLNNLDIGATSLSKPLQDMFNKIDDYLISQKNREQKESMSFLADPADMAFRVWRYPFYSYINTAFINEDFVQRWHEINDNIRALAKEKLGEIKIITGTGVITTNGEGSHILSPTNDVSAPVLWKIVYTEYKYFAVAIIVHNMKSDEDTRIIKLCQPNSCQQIGWQRIIPENSDNFVECCDPSLITQTFNLPSVFALTSIPQYQSEFHAKAQKCNPEKYVVTKKEFPFVDIREKHVSEKQIEKYLLAPGESMGTFRHFCPDVGEVQNFVTRKYENQEKYTKCVYENNGLDTNCENPVRPFIHYNEKSSCGNIEGSAYYHMQYNICVSRLNLKENEVVISPTKMYLICYNKNSKKIEYIYYTFKSPKMLANDGIVAKNNFVSQLETFNSGLETLTEGISSIKEFEKKDIRDVKNNRLVLQMLVHPENMAFAAWKKATYHVLNTQPMWSHLTYAWNHINEHIRKFAIQENLDLHVRVGVFDDDALESIDKEFSSVWWILVESNESGTVVFMHNDPADRKSQQICGSYRISSGDSLLRGIIPEGVPENSVYCCKGNFIAEKMRFTPFHGFL